MGTPVPDRKREEQSVGSGEVVTYRLTAKELADVISRYGPPKGGMRMTLEGAKAALPREELIELLANGMTKREIVTRYRISIGMLYQLLSEYGLREQQTETKQEDVQFPDDVDWCKPICPRIDYPALSITSKQVRLNSVAINAYFSSTTWVKIGAYKGKVVIVSSNDDGNSFRLNKEKETAGSKIGSQSLAGQIIRKGIHPGRYAVKKNEQLGWIEAEKVD